MIGTAAMGMMKATMTTKRTTWAAQIAVLLVFLATGTASASSSLLAGNSCRDKNTLEGSFHQAWSSVSGEPHRGWGEVCTGSAADSVVAPIRGSASRRSDMPSPRNPEWLAGERGIPGKPGYLAEGWNSQLHGDASLAKVVVDELPGTPGIRLERELTSQELASLSKRFDEVEFGLVRKRIGDKDIWFLESGGPGQMGQIDTTWHIRGDAIMGTHTHPSGPYATEASRADLAVLEQLQESQRKAGMPIQQSAKIVTTDGHEFTFNSDFKNVEKGLRWSAK
jgi:hypothetical protein